jgi:DNA-binding transcriptional ArsR family regulator
MEAALRAIAEPRRREILRLVWDAERSAGEIAGHFDVSRPAISQHLRVLKEAELVSDRTRWMSSGGSSRTSGTRAWRA